MSIRSDEHALVALSLLDSQQDQGYYTGIPMRRVACILDILVDLGHASRTEKGTYILTPQGIAFARSARSRDHRGPKQELGESLKRSKHRCPSCRKRRGRGTGLRSWGQLGDMFVCGLCIERSK